MTYQRRRQAFHQLYARQMMVADEQPVPAPEPKPEGIACPKCGRMFKTHVPHFHKVKCDADAE